MRVRLGVLREYLAEALLTELSFDRNFLRHLKRATGLNVNTVSHRSQSIAEDWLDDAEAELGHPMWAGRRAQVIRFVAQRMPALLIRYHGDVGAAEQTMYNLLNSRFNSLRTDTR